MRKIDLTEYELDINVPPKDDQPAGTQKVKYDVRGTLIEVMFSPELNLLAAEILYRDDLARKIRDCKENTLLLEEAEYLKIKQAVDTIHGFGRNEVEFIRRVFDAPQVEVEVKQAEATSRT